MHTSAFQSCRIHHNGDYEGNLYITNEDSTSEVIGEKTTVIFTYRKLVNLYKRSNGIRILNITGKGEEESETKQISILSSDVEGLIGDRIIQKINDKLSNNISFTNLIKISEILKIKW